VERLGVRDDHGGDQAHVPGQRRDPGRGQHRVEPAAYLVGPAIRGAVAGGLQAQAVLDRDEVEQPAFGLGGQVSPVPAGEQLGRAGPGLTPGGGVPAGAVEGGGQDQGGAGRSGRARRGGAQDMLPFFGGVTS
jgi:hypothetical protein